MTNLVTGSPLSTLLRFNHEQIIKKVRKLIAEAKKEKMLETKGRKQFKMHGIG